ncbi:MAG: hypothetical protein RLY31_1822 [Bacteroidota bacterium]|jgi:sensor histidine kinase YesM
MNISVRPLPVNTIPAHVSFWLVYWFFSSMQDVVFISQFKENFNLPIVLGSMGLVYFNYYYWIPKYLIRQKRHGFYLLSIFALIVANAWLVNVFLRTFVSAQRYYYSWEGTFTLAVDTTVLVAFTTAFKFIQQWHERNNYAVQLEKKNLENELEMLRAQINPHFIFNTLNTIYFLLEHEEGERAKEALIRFSDTLSHQLYDYNKDLIDMGKEIDFLKNYISLQQLRHDEELLDLELELPSDAPGHHIAPMLLIPFVENAFKHASNAGGYRIAIRLSVQDGLLTFTTENTVHTPRFARTANSGIGLTNVRRRLDLTYPDKHVLSLEKDEHSFRVKLKINLA